MIRIFLAALLGLAIATPGAASTQLRRSVAQELPLWGYDSAEIDDLTSGQIAQLHHILYGNRSHSDKVGLIRSTIRGGYTWPRRHSGRDRN